jgi:hypothetical protein
MLIFVGIGNGYNPLAFYIFLSEILHCNAELRLLAMQDVRLVSLFGHDVPERKFGGQKFFIVFAWFLKIPAGSNC